MNHAKDYSVKKKKKTEKGGSYVIQIVVLVVS